MENNFLTDSQLPATVTDVKRLDRKIDNISQGQTGTGLPVGLTFMNDRLKTVQQNPSNSMSQEFLLANGKSWLSFVSPNGSAYTVIHFDGTNGVPVFEITSLGDVRKIGGGSFSAISDIRVKDNILSFEDGLNKVLNICPKTFNYKAVDGTPTQNYPSWLCEKTQYGVIAQELETVAPEMVTTSEDGFKSVDLSNLCLLLVNAVKEQNEMIVSLTARVTALETPVTP